tara:strand:+ start:146 stop:490 length:345 start_codon:yes stop_codon:yes gene_type:complete
MRKSEFKKIIKECIKEVFLEEGVLSTIIQEVYSGLNGTQIVEKARPRPTHPPASVDGTKQMLLNEIGRSSMNNVNVFENISASDLNEKAGDPGINLSGVPGLNTSKEIMKRISK